MSGRNPNVRVVNQLGEKGCIVTNNTTAVTVTGGDTINRFYVVAQATFTDITSSQVDGTIAGLEGVAFAAGEEIIVPGVTSYTLTSGTVIAYYKA